jgi:hypothetical protein
MKNSKILATGALMAAVAFPGTALAADADAASASKQCKMLRASMGEKAFNEAYGTNSNRSNAFGKCVSKRAKATERASKKAKTNASKECKAEHAADHVAFAAKYGKGKNGKNAHGKCVSGKAKAEKAKTVEAEVEATVSASKACRAERAADKDAFARKYGTNKHKRNAFGKCVSHHAKAKTRS